MEEIKKKQYESILRAAAALAIWSWLIGYPIAVNVFDFHILQAPLADCALFFGLPAVLVPFYLYLRTTFKTAQPITSGFFQSKNIALTTIILIAIFATTDYILVKKLKQPLFSVYMDSYLDGGTAIYFGTGYKIFAYHGVSPTRVHRGPKLDILYTSLLSIDGSFYEAYENNMKTGTTKKSRRR